MDRVFIEDLHIETVIGVYDWERDIRQTVALDVEMQWDISSAGHSDNIKDALDYHKVSKRLIEFIGGSRCLLVESLAEQCAALILKEFKVPWVRLKVSKLGAVANAKAVGVMIERCAVE